MQWLLAAFHWEAGLTVTRAGVLLLFPALSVRGCDTAALCVALSTTGAPNDNKHPVQRNFRAG